MPRSAEPGAYNAKVGRSVCPDRAGGLPGPGDPRLGAAGDRRASEERRLGVAQAGDRPCEAGRRRRGDRRRGTPPGRTWPGAPSGPGTEAVGPHYANKRTHAAIVIESLGTKPTASLTPEDVAELAGRLERDGHSATYIRNICATLRAACRWGIRKSMLESNPIAGYKTPVVPRCSRG